MARERFDQRLQQIPPAIYSTIAQIDEHKGQWVAGARLSPQILARLKQSVLVTSTGASTRIEGARLSDEDIEVSPFRVYLLFLFPVQEFHG